MDEEGRPKPNTEVQAPLQGALASASSPTVSLPGAPLPPGIHAGRTFAPGIAVSGRYRILRFVAAGGMGEVYEAEDLELGGVVALKTLRPEVAGDLRALERFRQEIALARQVTHPNVCRIFDVGWHREGTSPNSPGVAFLTMEFLQGETLAERLGREGALPPRDAMHLLLQMAEGLAAAHRAGVIHRDFKSANVMLEPDAEGVRAVVTDFGLARPGVSTGLSASGEIAGTPAYMAPEQLQGGAVSPATDVYAFGVVMCEVLTGSKPFAGDASLAAVINRLKKRDPSVSVTLRGENLGRAWAPIVLRCLEREPARRYGGGKDLLRALQEAAGTGATRRRLLWAGAAAALLLAAAVAVPFWLTRHGSGPGHARSPVPLAPRRSVAVLGFKNLSGRADTAWLSTALAEMLTTELAAGEHLRTVPGETISRMKRDLDLGEAESLAPDTLAKIRANLGADYVVLGSFVALPGPSGPTLRLDVRLQDTAAGETVASLAETGDEDKLFGLASQAGEALRAKLGAGPVTPTEEAAAQAMVPSDPVAARLYALGLDRMRLMNAAQALSFFQQAEAAQPSQPLIHAALSSAWSTLGYDGRARQEAEKAYDLSASLPREGRLVVEGRYRAAAGQWEKAQACFIALWGFFPDNVEYGLQLAAMLTKGGKGKEALATVEEMRRLPQAAQDPRVDLAEAEAAQSLSDWTHMEAASERAAKASAARNARGTLAQARLLAARAWRKLGEPQKALAASDEARAIYDALGDREGSAHAQTVRLFILSAQGDTKGTKDLGAKLLATYREIGNQRGTVMILNALANRAYDQGDLSQAARDYESCLTVLRDIDDKSSAARVSSNLANVLLLQGDLAAARRRHLESLALSREVGDKSASAYTLCALGELEAMGGDLAKAQGRFEESLALFTATGEKSGEAYAFYGLGEVHLPGGRLEAARKAHEEGLALREQLGEKGAADESRLALANLSLEEGKAAQAAADAGDLCKAFEAGKASGDAALACDLLARSSLALGKVPEAQEAAARARRFAKDEEDLGLAVIVGLTSAKVRGAAGDVSGAREALGGLLAQATKAGRQDLALKASLYLGELEMAAGDAASGRARLAALEKDASARGYVLIARKAAAARKA